MKFTLSWLKKHLDTTADTETILKTLTNIGLEVEDCYNPSKNLNGFVVAKILSIRAHPDADRLKLCLVDKGDENIEIVTGFYRDDCCNTGIDDHGLHTVCCEMTSEFLIFSKSVGNDLSSPIPEYNFHGLSEGNLWCLCASRWHEAYLAGKAPKVILKSTNIATLSIIALDDLKKHSSE